MMKPEYTNEPFVWYDEHGDCVSIPADVANTLPEGTEYFAYETGKWFARLSARGYLDSTDWSGPFDTIEKAKAHIVRVFEVDAETGDELPND